MAQKRRAGADADTGTPHVALLRGINLGGNRIPMPALAAIFTEAGCADVSTYIASGNVVFNASAKVAARLPTVVPKAISEGYGFDSPVVIRTAEEMAAARDENPFFKAGDPPESLHVSFLADAPTAAAVAGLDQGRSPPDRFAVRGREIYLCLPNGGARSKLTNAYFDSRLKTVSTVRNWRTVLKLIELMEGISSRPASRPRSRS